MSSGERTDLLRHTIKRVGKSRMNPHNTEHRKINVLELSEIEKAEFTQEVRKYLREKLEEAKFWRTLAQKDQRVLKGLPAAFQESNLSSFEEANNLQNFS